MILSLILEQSRISTASRNLCYWSPYTACQMSFVAIARSPKKVLLLKVITISRSMCQAEGISAAP